MVAATAFAPQTGWPAMPTHERSTWVALDKVIPDECFDDARYCSTEGAAYLLWEREVAQRALHSKGWLVHSWCAGERDSFGPLTRYAVAEVRGKVYRLVYG